jgi:uncharacterized protein YbjT (DUF2867 family)
VAARAARGAEVRRVIALSVAGAAPDALDPLRRAKAAMEAAFADLPCPTIVLRLGLVDTPTLRDALMTAGLGPVHLDVVVRPVRVTDVLELVVAFDRARARSTQGHLVVAADGPQAMSVAGYLDRATGSRAGRGRLLGRRLPDAATIDRLVTTLAGPWEQTEPHLLDGWGFAQLEPGVPGPSSG